MMFLKFGFLSLLAACTFCACDDDDDDQTDGGAGGGSQKAGCSGSNCVSPQIISGSKTCEDYEAVKPCGGEIEGSWKMLDICVPADEGDSTVADMTEMLQCKIDNNTSTKMWGGVTIAGETYKMTGGGSLSGNIVFHSDCFTRVSCQQMLEESKGQSEEGIDFGKCSCTSSGGVCGLDYVYDATEEGSIEISGTHFKLTPTKPSEEEQDLSEGDFCVQGNKLILKTESDGIWVFSK